MEIFDIPEHLRYPVRQRHYLSMGISDQGETASLLCRHPEIDPEVGDCHAVFFLDDGLFDFFSYYESESDENKFHDLAPGEIFTWMSLDENFHWRYLTDEELKAEASK